MFGNDVHFRLASRHSDCWIGRVWRPNPAGSEFGGWRKGSHRAYFLEMQKSNASSATGQPRNRRGNPETATHGGTLPTGSNKGSSGAEMTSRRRQNLLICLGLLALVALVYWPVWRFGFVNYDDGEYVSENLRVQAGWTLENIKWAFGTFYFENWHPLTWLSYFLDSQLFGINPAAFHLVNVAFHALNTLLLFAVFQRMTGARWPSAFVAALFAVHSLHVESVAWVAERKDVLSGFFWMLTLWAYVRYVQERHWGRYLVTLLFFALGLMAKPMLVTLPFVLLLLDFWPLRRMAWSGQGGLASSRDAQSVGGRRSLGQLVLEKAPFLVLTVVSSVITFLAQHGARVTALNLPVPQRIENAVLSYGRYLGKTVWPRGLAVYYPHPGHWPVLEVVGAALVLVGLTGLSVWQWRRRPYLATGWFWFLGTLVPVIGLVQVGGQSMADRYMYVPLIGLLAMASWGAIELAERLKAKAGLALIGSAAVLACGLASRVQVGYWHDSVGLFEHALAVTKGSTIAHTSLGDALISLGKTNEAMAHFSAALEIEPEDALAHGNIGNVLLGQGKTEEALARYKQGLQFSPKNPELNHNIGMCLARLGKFAEAVPYYSAALQLRAEYADAYLNLGNALAALGKFDEAIANYATVLRLKPGYAPAHLNIGNALTQQGKQVEAAAQYIEALHLQPDNPQAHCNLGLALAGQGKVHDAMAHLMEAVRLSPGESQYHFHLATALAAEKRTQEAIEQYREAVHLKPDSVLALNNLAWILATHADAKLRDGVEAVRSAERACELTSRKQAFLLGTLAAAYAEAGRFPEAIATAEKAAELATAAGQKDIAANNQKLLEVYRGGKPFREGEQPN